MAAKSIHVLLADDHRLVRAGIRALLENASGIEVVGEADDGRTAIKLVRMLRPHVVLMDVGMKYMNGLEAAERVIRKFPSTRAIILSVHREEEYVARALRLGACGYLLKDSAPSELVVAVRAVAEGGTYLSPAVSTRVVAGYLRGGERGGDDVLTPRQREVLQLVAEGNTSKEIAQLLGVSPKTVETHRMDLMQRLDVHDVAGLVRYAMKHGLARDDE